MRLPSVMKHSFSEVPKADIPRSQLDRSHGYKTTFDAGWLVPCFVDEALPGDTFNVSMEAFGRLATPLHPFMDNVFLSTFFFAIPYRLLWDNWEKFNGAQDNPADSTDFLLPVMASPPSTGYGEQSLSDYFGIPTKIPDLIHTSLVHRAYNLTWNEWFRDQNLQDSAFIDTGDGPDVESNFPLRRRGKRHDYFTSALPWPQKGTSVEIPIGTSAALTWPAAPSINPLAGNFPTFQSSGGGAASTLAAQAGGNVALTTAPPAGTLTWAGDGLEVNQTELELGTADLSTATAATINQLRQAFQVQRLYERDARGGTRYTEIVKSHFGVTSPDARLQRPEYLGGGTTMVNVTPIPQTSETATTPQGNLAGFGTVNASRHGFVKSFTEHCILLGLVSVRADLNYQQGLSRMFSRSTRFDFYWPALAQIGEQTILNKEIFAQGTLASSDEDVFGYQERFAEYRYKPSLVTGQFRSNAATPLDTWHLAQDFASLPALSADFIEEDPPIDRVIAVPSEPHFLLDSYFKMKCARPMPTYGVPGMIDHF